MKRVLWCKKLGKWGWTGIVAAMLLLGGGLYSCSTKEPQICFTPDGLQTVCRPTARYDLKQVQPFNACKPVPASRNRSGNTACCEDANGRLYFIQANAGSMP